MSDKSPLGATARPPKARGERSRGASVALHTTLAVASLIALFPVLFVVFVSLRGRDGWQEPTRFVGFDLSNYTHILGETKFLTWFGNSVIVSLGATLLGVFVAATAGYAVSRMRFPGHRSLMWTFLVVQMFPMAVLIVPLYNILGELELLDSYLGLIVTYCSVSVPFCAWMLKGYFDTIPAEIDEAGRVDGLSPFGTFWRLILPLARPGLAVTGFYSFITAWGEVAFATQFMSSEEHYTLAVGLQTFVGQQKAEWGLMTAAAVLIAVPAGAVFFLAQRHLVAGLTAGGTKG
ncbi:sugar ABC transporter permease [Streptomyces albireticuli]|uniref:ABC transporter permease n=1 Tax=Streptomyces albireticuli TaxID=1940 RepID=A0A2A2DGA5_9ACTN|nr:carbohydrate ABC transporter permease [Streptomyces albireticuli]MCD9142033.1 carbohydrate ABC transporter permease [Streptomyces albireticuli]MCD9163023.1 carbohydrate ABC transporter permease [Streptomyces albireticuli]MCD9190207.1 carbohydrate ABC transporter permease [Streptomyces albireticuli]PAU50302.1 ABC transporter permease [Streptomyces albireticuli]